MDILLRQVFIIDPSSPFHQQKADIFIQNGQIIEIGALSLEADHIIGGENVCVSPGWVDPFSHFCDPGFEFKETLTTGAAAAVAGGYTDVFIVPNTAPPLHNKSGIEYIVQKSRHLPIHIHPLAAITKNLEGKELAEMYDMLGSGAVAYSDGLSPIQSPGLLLKALQYIKAVHKTIIQLPDERSISGPGLMNEGIISTRLGLPGRPAIAEELMIARDIELAFYTESKIHFTGISTAKSVQLINDARAKGINVTCSVTPYHLFFSDEDLQDYDTNLKVNPPIRSREDMLALRNAVNNGSIDCIATHHAPQDKDHKIVEFEYAQYGMTGLETAFAAVCTILPELSTERLVHLFSINARRIFDLQQASINKNVPASLTIFDRNKKWKFERFKSKSSNSPFLNKELTGKPIGIITKQTLFLNQD